MKKLKFLLTAVLLTAMSLSAWAQTTQRLVVWQQDGKKDYYELAEEPRTTFSNGQITIKTSTTEVSYPMSKVVRYTYEGITNVISNVRSDGFTFSQKDNVFTLRNVPAGMSVQVYDASGMLLQSVKSDGLSPVTLSLDNRPQGVYIVKFGDQAFKLMKR